MINKYSDVSFAFWKSLQESHLCSFSALVICGFFSPSTPWTLPQSFFLSRHHSTESWIVHACSGTEQGWTQQYSMYTACWCLRLIKIFTSNKNECISEYLWVYGTFYHAEKNMLPELPNNKSFKNKKIVLKNVVFSKW